MHGIQEGEQGSHCNGVDTVCLEQLHHLAHLLLIQGLDHLAVKADALWHALVHAGLDQRLGLLGQGVIHLGALLQADLHNVMKALGGNQPHTGTFFLNQGVGGHCGAVGQIDHLGRIRVLHGQHLLNAVHDGNGGVLIGRAVFEVEQFSGFLMEN